jgi:hypothetical protein
VFSVCDARFIRWRTTYAVPGAGAAVVRALVALEDVDQHTGVEVVVDRARAASRRASRSGRAVRLVRVLECARDVLPSAGAARVGTLVTLERKLSSSGTSPCLSPLTGK